MPGSDVARKPTWIGSHIDTVINGGMFDGLTGVACALEVVRCLKESAFNNKTPISVVVFSEEEGTGFGSTTTGSKAIAGLYSIDDLKKLKGEDNTSYYDALKRNNYKPDHLPDDVILSGDLEAMFELHIEQGNYLTHVTHPSLIEALGTMISVRKGKASFATQSGSNGAY